MLGSPKTPKSKAIKTFCPLSHRRLKTTTLYYLFSTFLPFGKGKRMKKRLHSSSGQLTGWSNADLGLRDGNNDQSSVCVVGGHQ